MPIVPVPFVFREPTGPQFLPPNQCYLKENYHPNLKLLYKLFVFVNFGTSANSFLKACGMKGEPSMEDIVLELLKDPQRFLRLTGGWDE